MNVLAVIRAQKEDLQKGCDILVATPGRLAEFMRDPELLSLKRLRFTILDEADEFLSGDWDNEIETIFTGGDVNTGDDHRVWDDLPTLFNHFIHLLLFYLQYRLHIIYRRGELIFHHGSFVIR